MRALVTGANGFIGAALTRALLRNGWSVACLVRDGRTPRVEGVTSHPFDLLDRASLAFDRSIGGRFDAVFHLAAALPKSKPESEAEFIDANASATLRLLEAAARGGASRFVYLSSISVIGAPTSVPVRESHPVAPQLAYSVGKLGGELACSIMRPKGVCAVALRLTSPYGLGMAETTVLPSFVAAALAGRTLQWHGSGARSQDFIHVDDVVAACIAAAVAPAPAAVYNLASGGDVSMRRLVELVVSLAPGSGCGPSGADDPQEDLRWSIDISAARRDLGFAPVVSIEKGVARYMAERRSDARPWTWW